jgi:hypothetical protein
MSTVIDTVVEEDAPGVNFDFNQYPTLLRMQQSPAKVKAVIGPAGSAKTSGAIAMLLVLALMQKPFRGVRRSRAICARQSYQQLAKSTVQSLKNVLGAVATFTDGKPPRGRADFDVGDGTRCEIEFVFVAMEGDNVEGDLRGLEGSFALLDEISEMLSEDLVNLLISRLGRYPSAMEGGCTSGGVALACTNGPREGHWLHDLSLGKRDVEFARIAKQTGRPYFELFRQPPALLRPDTPDGDWRPNPQAENVVNLPGGYGFYFSMLSMSDEKVQAFVEGEFSALKAGKPVYPGFGKIHIVPQELFKRTWSRGPLLVSFDFGRTPVMLIAVERTDGSLVVIDEVCAEDVSIETFWLNHGRPVIDTKYMQCRYAGATGDPAGMDLGGTTETSPFQILQAHGVPIEPPQGGRVDRLAPRIEATRNRLARLGTTGIPMLTITDNCKLLIEAIGRNYVYAQVRGQGEGVVAESPTKSHKNWVSDLANALEYLCLYRAGELERAGDDPYGPERRPSRPLLGG